MIDIGANLCHDIFDADREATLQRAREAGVNRIIITGSCLESSPAALELAKQHSGFLYATAGIHPHHAKQVNTHAIEQLRILANQPEVVATGEMGLDFYRDFCPHDIQEKAFELQLELAAEIGKPLFLHQRDAHERFLPILKDYLPKLSRVVVHCFTGSQAELHDYLDLDLYIGITGWVCDERRGQHLWKIIEDIPSDRLMVETDSPYLLPRNLKPKPNSRRNEPFYLKNVIESICAHTSRPYDQVISETTDTANHFFNLR